MKEKSSKKRKYKNLKRKRGSKCLITIAVSVVFVVIFIVVMFFINRLYREKRSDLEEYDNAKLSISSESDQIEGQVMLLVKDDITNDSGILNASYHYILRYELPSNPSSHSIEKEECNYIAVLRSKNDIILESSSMVQPLRCDDPVLEDSLNNMNLSGEELQSYLCGRDSSNSEKQVKNFYLKMVVEYPSYEDFLEADQIEIYDSSSFIRKAETGEVVELSRAVRDGDLVISYGLNFIEE